MPLRRQRGALQVAAAIKKKAEKNVVCCKTLVVKEEALDEVAKLCDEVTAWSQARIGDRESGLLSFECTKDAFEPNVLYFWERYESNGALGRHNTSEQVKHFMERVEPHLEKGVGMVLYEWRDGKLGAPAIPEGPKGEGGLDDATGAGGSGGASMKQTSSTVDTGNLREEKEEEVWGLKLPKWFQDVTGAGKKE